MTERIAKLFSTPKRRLAAACSALALCWLVMLPMFFGRIFVSSDISGARGELELKKARSEYAAALAEKKEADSLRDRCRKLIDGAWREERDGMIEVGMRRMVGGAADSVENFKLQSLGSVRCSRINHELYCGELDVTATGTLDKIAAFLAAVGKAAPALHWRRLELRPDFRAQWQRARRSETLNLAKTPEPQATQISLSGSLRLLGYDGKLRGGAADAGRKTPASGTTAGAAAVSGEEAKR